MEEFSKGPSQKEDFIRLDMWAGLEGDLWVYKFEPWSLWISSAAFSAQ